ncbi:MAG TPA: type II secretion system F family protein [Candidatus Saccharimonadales bacterium]|nr:type II secretion system F family protein [Candidatus Saccharimonadales bacterium]
MLTFTYTARDPATGNKIKAQVQAESEVAAAKLIQKEGLAPLEIKVLNETSGGVVGKIRNRIKTKDKVIFSRQMATLINAGLPLVQSLRNVGSQTPNKAFKVVINQIISDIEGGKAFSVALAAHPTVFNDVYISLIASGEVSGTLDKSLERIANQQEKDAEIISKIRGALAYPVIVILVMMVVVGFMVVKVMPQVEDIYKDIPGATLPLITRILLAISHFIIHFWWAVIIALILLAIAMTRYARTGPGKQVVDSLKMHMWPIGPLFMKVYMARFARTGTTLVSSGIPLIKMLEVVGEAINNVHIQRSIGRASEKVKGGKSLADALEGDPNFLPLVPNMLRIGEESGSLEDMLEKTADYYEKEVDTQIKAISTIIEPVLMVLLGVVAFIIVAAVLLPIYGLAGKNIIQT